MPFAVMARCTASGAAVAGATCPRHVCAGPPCKNKVLYVSSSLKYSLHMKPTQLSTCETPAWRRISLFLAT